MISLFKVMFKAITDASSSPDLMFVAGTYRIPSTRTPNVTLETNLERLCSTCWMIRREVITISIPNYVFGISKIMALGSLYDWLY